MPIATSTSTSDLAAPPPDLKRVASAEPPPPPTPAGPYPIGTPGVAWGDAEKRAWLARAHEVQRSYKTDVLEKLARRRAAELENPTSRRDDSSE